MMLEADPLLHYNTDILYVCQTNDFSAVEKCLNQGACANFQNTEGESPLQVAAAYGFSDIVDLLLKNGAIIDLPNNYGWTPLMHAARYGHTTAVALLVKMKAKVNISNKLGLSPILLAAGNGSLSTIKLLIQAGAVVEHMPSPDQSNECDLSAAMVASLQGHEEILRFLLEEGARIDIISPITNLSPLMLAASEGHKKVVNLIVECSGDLNQRDVSGCSAFDHAVNSNQQEVVEYLENIRASYSKNDQLLNTDNMQTSRSASFNASMTDNLSPRQIDDVFSPKKENYRTSSNRGKLSASDRRSPKRSQTETKVKGWIGGVAQHLQHKVLTHLSYRRSEKNSDIDIPLSDETVNEVFDEQKLPLEQLEPPQLKPSILLSPNEYLASALKEHVVEAIKPPFPPTPYSNVMKRLAAKKLLMENNPKPHAVSLQTPNLLKRYTKKKHSVGSNKDSTSKSSTPIKSTENFSSISAPIDDSSQLSLKTKGAIEIMEPQPSSSNAADDSCANNFEGDLTVLLNAESLQQYVKKFRDQEIDIKTFQHLTKDDLDEMGIQSSGSQRKLIELINKLQNKT